MGSAPPGRCLLGDSVRCCESRERERGMTLTGRSKQVHASKDIIGLQQFT